MLTNAPKPDIILPDMRKIAVILALVYALFVAKPVMAEETCVQVQVYGGGVGTVCGAKTHETVDTDFAGITPAMFGGGLVGLSGVLVYFSRKVRSQKLA
jgi:hypothetical protein